MSVDRFWWSQKTRESIDAHFFISFFPVSLLHIRELWIGHGRRTRPGSARKRAAAGLRGAFEVLTDLEDLTIVRCKMEPFLQTLGETVGGRILLPEFAETHSLRWVWGYGCLGTYSMHEIKEGALPAP